MKISITNAQVMVESLQAGIKHAMDNGEFEFDVTPVLQAADDAARKELELAIAAARTAGA
jgi:hypothetical protein